jgi:PAS domain S-box-containing protein
MHVRDGAAPAEVRAALDWYRTMADATPVSIWISGIDKQSTYFNKRWLQFTGRGLERELGIGWSEVVHPDDFERCLATFVEAFDARRDFEMECRSRRHDGIYRWLLNRGNPVHAADGTFLGYIGSCIDVTERKEAQAQLEWEHAAELVRLSEEHDYLQQTVFAIGLTAKARLANPLAEPWYEVTETLSRVTDLATAGAERLREAILALNHAEGVGRGLVQLLWGLSAAFRLRTGIEADVVLTGLQRRLPTAVAEALYAAAREALANVERHSNASAVILGLHITHQNVTLSIQDDGTGASFPAPQSTLNSATCFGLRSVGQRVRDLNGSFAAGPNPDGGFQVRALLPLKSGLLDPVVRREARPR